ncbi:hypothetical protein HYH03_000254 [Edaphochlamys debaryana]|uniref:S1 motif domain-containing protein n=1 Tax=Edaphochlamys debaryana TaxID=47281 RepID=A0A835YQ14_9CHLO|nr:hypothetical protein HYH03_000254 [Edaphochlamys debaryana]|eukprot:KAG2501754.1 hypothetical protein HYH03_000254 [Edaphochlamys debaryana]
MYSIAVGLRGPGPGALRPAVAGNGRRPSIAVAALPPSIFAGGRGRGQSSPVQGRGRGQVTPNDAIVAAGELLKATRARLHREGRVALFSEALKEAWPQLCELPSLRTPGDVIYLARTNQSAYLYEYLSRERRVRAHIDAFLAVYSGFATLHDLEAFVMERERGFLGLEESAPGMQCFNDLMVGPLWAQPGLVAAGLAPEGMTEMPQTKVTRADVLLLLVRWLNERRFTELPTGPKLAEALEAHYGKPLRELGISAMRPDMLVVDVRRLTQQFSNEMRKSKRDVVERRAPTAAESDAEDDDDDEEEDGGGDAALETPFKNLDVVEGKVQALQPYGAFVELPGGFTGLLHLSAVSNEKVLEIKNVLSEGQALRVMVLDVDRGAGRTTLSTKVLEPAKGDMLKDPQLVYDKAEEMGAKYREAQAGRETREEERASRRMKEAAAVNAMDLSSPGQLLAVLEERLRGVLGKKVWGRLPGAADALRRLEGNLDRHPPANSLRKLKTRIVEVYPTPPFTVPPTKKISRKDVQDAALAVYPYLVRALQDAAAVVAELNSEQRRAAAAKAGAGAEAEAEAEGSQDLIWQKWQPDDAEVGGSRRAREADQQAEPTQPERPAQAADRVPPPGPEATGPRPPPVSRQRLREAVAAHYRSLSFRSLAQLERNAAHELGAATFADLGRGESLLAALAEDPELAELLLGGGPGSAGAAPAGALEDPASAPLAVGAVREAEALRMAALVAGARGDTGPPPAAASDGSLAGPHASSAAAASLEAAVRLQWGAPSVRALGFGPPERLLQEAAEHMGAADAAASAAVLPAYGLAPPHPPNAASGYEGAGAAAAAAAGSALLAAQPVGPGALAAAAQLEGDGSGRSAPAAAAALAALDAAPMLCELGRWALWEEAFAPELGPLRAFLLGREASSARGGGAAGRGWRALEAPGGRLVKVPAGLGLEGSVALFAQRLTEGDARGMATALLSAAADAGGVEALPAQYLSGLVEGRWAEWAEAGGQAGRARVLRCCLDCVAALGVTPLRGALASRVLLPALESPRVVGRGWRLALLAAAETAEQRSALHALGAELRERDWLQDWAGAVWAAAATTAAAAEAPPVQSPAAAASVTAEAARLAAGLPAAGVERTAGQENPPLPAADGAAAPSVAPPDEKLANAEAPMPSVAAAAESALAPAPLGAEEVAARRAAAAAVVERIQHTYGVGKEFSDPDARDTIATNTQRVGNAVAQLSEQLYSRDVHFVMELLQNAEDNAYPPGVPPGLEFVLTRTALVVANNEAGFTERDVRALSDVNASTKKKKRGYIGKKGIGFKSVFKVSDAPEVHSNGFHIAFDRTAHGNLGLVLPSPVAPYTGEGLPSQLGLLPHPATLIRLPLRTPASPLRSDAGSDDEARAQEAAVAGWITALREVEPKLLLFLRKLRRIAITDATHVPEALGERGPEGTAPPPQLQAPAPASSLSVCMTRVDVGGGVVALRTERGGAGAGAGAEETRYLLVTDTFAPSVGRADLSVSELGDTTVSLAFDLGAAAELAAAAAAGERPLPRPPRQDVFAFLPTRDYGLRFVVNADFELTTSRESISGGSPYNQMLASRIPALFARSLSELQRLGQLPSAAEPGDASPPLGPHAWLCYWLACMPLPSEAQGPFAPLVGPIAEAARHAVLLPTACGQMLSPATHALRVCTDPAARELLALPAVQAALRSASIAFVSDAVAPLHESPELRKLLRVQSFGAADMVALLEQLLLSSQHPSAPASASTSPSSSPRPEGPLSVPTLARLLLLTFTLLQGQGQGPTQRTDALRRRGSPSLSGTGAGGAGSDLWSALRRLPLLPLLGGGPWAAPAAAGGAAPTGVSSAPSPVFLLPGSEGPSAPDLAPLLSSLGLPPDLGPLTQPLAPEGSPAPAPPSALRFLDPALLEAADGEEERGVLLGGLRALGLRRLEAEDAAERACLPLLSSAAAAEGGVAEAAMVAALALPLAAGLLGPAVGAAAPSRMLPQRSGSTASGLAGGRRGSSSGGAGGSRMLEALRRDAVLLRAQGGVVRLSDLRSGGAELWLPPALCPGGLDAAAVVPGRAGAAVVSGAYLGCEAVPKEAWSSLFRALGATPFLRLVPRTVYLRPAAPSSDGGSGGNQPGAGPGEAVTMALSDSPWAALEAAGPGTELNETTPRLPACPPGHVLALADVACPGLEALLRAAFGVGPPDGPGKEAEQEHGLNGGQLTAAQAAALGRVAAALHATWGDGGYGEGLTLRAPVRVLSEEEARLEAEEGQRVGEARDGLEARARDESDGGAPLLPSSFLLQLRTSRWLPSALGGACSPAELFPRLPQLTELLGDSPLPYLAPIPGLPSDSPLLNALGFPQRLTPTLLLSALRALAQGPAGGPASSPAAGEGRTDAAGEGRTSAGRGLMSLGVEGLGAVYRYLGAALAQAGPEERREVEASFAREALVWIPEAAGGSTAAAGPAAGRFLGAAQVVLTDPTGVVEALAAEQWAEAEAAEQPALPRVLSAHYPARALALFEELSAPPASDAATPHQQGGGPLVAREPSAAALLAALRCLQARAPQPSPDAVSKIRAVLLHLWKRDADVSEDRQALRPTLAALELFPTRVGGWASVAGGLLVGDSPALEAQLISAAGLQLLDPAFCAGEGGSGTAGDAEALLEWLGAPRLSELAEEEAAFYGRKPAAAGSSALVAVAAALAQRFVAACRPGAYAQQREGVAARLRALAVEEVAAGSLQVRYAVRLPSGAAVRTPLNERSALVLFSAAEPQGPAGQAGGCCLLLDPSSRSHPQLCDQLSRLFTGAPTMVAGRKRSGSEPDPELSSFLQAALLAHMADSDASAPCQPSPGAQRYALERGCGPLPPGEPVWQVTAALVDGAAEGPGAALPGSSPHAAPSSAPAPASVPAPAPAAAALALPEADPDELLATGVLRRQQRSTGSSAAGAPLGSAAGGAMGGAGGASGGGAAGGAPGEAGAETAGAETVTAGPDGEAPSSPDDLASVEPATNAGDLALPRDAPPPGTYGTYTPYRPYGSWQGRGRGWAAAEIPGSRTAGRYGTGDRWMYGLGDRYGVDYGYMDDFWQSLDESQPWSGWTGRTGLGRGAGRGRSGAFRSRGGRAVRGWGALEALLRSERGGSGPAGASWPWDVKAVGGSGSDSAWGPAAAQGGDGDREGGDGGANGGGVGEQLLDLPQPGLPEADAANGGPEGPEAVVGEAAGGDGRLLFEDSAAAAEDWLPLAQLLQAQTPSTAPSPSEPLPDTAADPTAQLNTAVAQLLAGASAASAASDAANLFGGPAPLDLDAALGLAPAATEPAAAAAAAEEGGSSAGVGAEGWAPGVSDVAAATRAEALVAAVLGASPAVTEGGWAVEWVSGQPGMRTAPYDILLTRGAERLFVEVKSSSAAAKDTFEISTRELALAMRERDSYVIVRVTGLRRDGSGLGGVRLRALADPWGLAEEGRLQVVMRG